MDIEKKLQKSYADADEEMERKAVESIKKNAKFFYSYAKKKAKCKSKIGPLNTNKTELTSDPKEMAELLSTQYASVFSVPKQDAGEPTALKTDKKLSDITFTTEDIESAIGELRSNAAAGDDGFPAIL